MTQNQETKFFQVTAKCGHVKKNNYVPVNFAIYAKNASEAAQFAKRLPRVKKHLKDAIIACVEISEEEFQVLRDNNRRDPYLNAKRHRDIEHGESFLERIVHTERKRKEEKPLSMKYRYWKHVGRYACLGE